MFRSRFININHAYTALLLYAHRRRQSGRPFKLKSIALAGDLGGRGINYKPHGFRGDTHDTWIIPPHHGYLTDMFFMFDAVVNRQITTHGEYILQAIGRLCTLVDDEMLARMATTPPRLFTSYSCYSIIRTFALGVQQWVQVMSTKQHNESIKDALVRSIRTEPERFRELWMIYVVPHTDPRWAKKELWVRTSRLMRADKMVGESVRAAPSMPAPPISGGGGHGIQHNPDNDRQKRIRSAMSKAEADIAAGGDDEDDEEEEEPQPRVSRRRLARPANREQMNEKFQRSIELLQTYASLAFLNYLCKDDVYIRSRERPVNEVTVLAELRKCLAVHVWLQTAKSFKRSLNRSPSTRTQNLFRVVCPALQSAIFCLIQRVWRSPRIW